MLLIIPNLMDGRCLVKNMKLKYCFTLIVVLIILFSLGCVAASENITSDDVCLDSDSSEFVSDDLGINENQDALKENSLSDEVDLSVNVNKLNKDLENSTIVTVPFNVIASVSGGTAHDTKVQISHDFNDFEYVSHNATQGSYDPTSHIWDIGDLNSSYSPSLTILTKFDTQGRNLTSIGIIVIANATTTSKDVDLSNNFLIQPVVYAAPIYYTEESDDKEGPQHGDHQGSDPSGNYVVIIIGEENAGNSTNSQDSEGKSQSNATSGVNPSSDENSNSKSGEGSKSNSQNGISSNSNSNNATKEINQGLFTNAINSLTDVIPKDLNSLGNLITDIFGLNSGSTNGNSDNSSKSVEGLQAYDYTKIPLLIFSTFLIILVAVVGYDKIKS